MTDTPPTAPPPVYVLGTGPWYAECQGCGWQGRSRYTLDAACDDQWDHRCPPAAAPTQENPHA